MERFDLQQMPFDCLTPAQRKRLQAAVDIVFFDDHQEIIRPQERIEHLYVLMKGRVKELGSNGEVVAVYRQQDTFEARALIEGSSRHRFVVQEQALLYRLPKAHLLALMEENAAFASYFYASVAEKLAQSTGGRRGEWQDLFSGKVAEAFRREQHWLRGEQSMLAAAQCMKEHQLKSLLIRDGERIGLLTESVFRDMILAGAAPTEALRAWARFELIGAEAEESIIQALLRMMECRIQRLVVYENGQPVGLLEHLDVLAYLSNHSQLMMQRLQGIRDLEELRRVALDMQPAIIALHRRGMPAPQLAQLVQTLNSTLFEQAWRFIAPEALYRSSCLLVMGSEGRGEQILKTDQDNALILGEGFSPAEALPVAQRFSDFLRALGYPPCDGGIMVNRPQWCQPLAAFRHNLSRWCAEPTPQNMMHLAIFMDAKAVAGDESLLRAAKEHLGQVLGKDVALLMNFAAAVDLFEGHSQGFFAQWLQRHSEKMDIKKMGIFPLVHGIRSLALEARLTVNNSFERLQQLMQQKRLPEHLGRDAAEALSYLMQLRLRAALDEDSPANQIDMARLSALERDLLKDALQVVKRFRAHIRQHFHLGGR